MFQIHLDVKNRYEMLRMLQAYVSSVSDVSDICFKCFIWILHVMLLWLYMHVLSVCFKYFRHMLQVFHINVAKVDLNVVYVAMVIHTCFKRIFQMFCLFLELYYKCFVYTL
jgi:hypothetical protein